MYIPQPGMEELSQPREKGEDSSLLSFSNTPSEIKAGWDRRRKEEKKLEGREGGKKTVQKSSACLSDHCVQLGNREY